MRIPITTRLSLAMLLIFPPFGRALAADEIETRTGRIEVSYPFPPAADFSKFVTPIAKHYGVTPPESSCNALGASELDEKGAIKPKSPTEPSVTQPATQ